MITHYNYVANATQFAHLGELHPDSAEKTKRAQVNPIPESINRHMLIDFQEMALLPSNVPRHVPDNYDSRWAQTTDSRLHHEEIRLCGHVGSRTEV
jgi:hypothetical protein